MTEQLGHLSLFSGIGGIDLAAEWAGFETVCFVEIDKFCQKVLRKHWPDVPIVEDIHDVTKEKVMAYTAEHGCHEYPRWQRRGETQEGWLLQPKPSDSSGGNGKDTTQFPITLITGGFPCQPVSVAGKRRGKEDDRWLWPEMLRVISEVRPTWVVAENVAGLLRMGLDDCLADLEGEGFEVQTFLIPACGVNAPHQRYRIFIVAHSEHDGRLGAEITGGVGTRNGTSPRQGRTKQFEGSSCCEGRIEDVADTTEFRPSRRRAGENGLCNSTEGIKTEIQSKCGLWWAVEPDVGRVATRIPSRVDRLRALGNAVVPQQIYPILRAIADIEKGL